MIFPSFFFKKYKKFPNWAIGLWYQKRVFPLNLRCFHNKNTIFTLLFSFFSTKITIVTIFITRHDYLSCIIYYQVIFDYINWSKVSQTVRGQPNWNGFKVNVIYLQLKNSILTFYFFKIIKEKWKKSNWIVVSNLGFPLKSTMLSQ